MSFLVMKFGGTSVGNSERIKNVSKKIVRSVRRKEKVLVVVSAMAGYTDNLISKTKEFGNCQFNPEFDSILSTGEQLSSGLLSMYLNSKKIRSRSIMGWQIPIDTDSNYGKARIKKINNKNLIKLFDDFEVLVVAGFQGVDCLGRITTLGRGGSDTTAVALAASIKSEICEIYTDVDGIYTADPRDVKTAKKLNNITYEETLELSSLGSKVLHPRSVELAMKYDIKVHVRSSFSSKRGTFVLKEGKNLEKELVTGITSSVDDAKITLIGISDNPGVASRIFTPLAVANINVDMIVQNITDDGKLTSLTFTVSKTEHLKAVDVLNQAKIKYRNIHVDKNISKVSIVGVGMKSNVGVAKKMFETLAKKNINIQVISTSEIKISVLIASRSRKIAVQSLHKTYNLDKIN